MSTHTQAIRPDANHQEKFTSALLIALITFAFLIVLMMFFFLEWKLLYAILLISIIFLLLNAYSINVQIDGTEIIYFYGIGLFSTSIHFNSIASCDIQPNRFFRSWIYNPKGESALILNFRDGKKIDLPSNEPRKIVQIIQNKV